ncbi:MAG TPA: tetratricopeptide repeat protein [Steroidobacteraceae bacterium]|jgi:DNA-binding transcriptional MerR regulator|nr:tetratricopeptide repeat protein [Steroidobacteraceae bacterium]
MQTYSVRDIERVLRLSRSTIRGLIDVGFVTPTRGPRREYRFSFQDLIVLRAARALIQAKVSRRRIRRSLEDLRKHLPQTMPLSGLSICAVGDRVVVRDGNSQYQVDSGQYVLGLDVTVEDGVLRVVEKEFGTRDDDGPEPPRNAEDWFDDGLDFEENGNIDQAIEAYQQTVALDGQNVAAWINWGRLLHDRGNKREAEAVYRRAIELCGPDAVLMFNLGVLLEDLGRTLAALEAYQSAVGEDPALADGHYNLARLYESLGQPQHAIRHLGQYRRLLNSESR